MVKVKFCFVWFSGDRSVRHPDRLGARTGGRRPHHRRPRFLLRPLQAGRKTAEKNGRNEQLI